MGKNFLKLAFVSGLLLLTSCNENHNKQDLYGAWQVDSTASYYNGFTYTNKKGGKDWGLCVFGKDGLMRESKYNTYRSFLYGFMGRDSIYLAPTNSQASDTSKFRIVRLDRTNMVLKSEKPALFESNIPQERFEIRYYSKTKEPSEDLEVLNGYKN
ncbi:MAG: hypothetical protein ABJN84_15680 [Flavobacteriaceae bacterium]